VVRSSVHYQDTFYQVTSYFAAHGSSALHAQRQAFAWIGQQVQTQASLLSYIDVFWTLMVICAAAIPLALLLRKVKLGGPAPMGHQSRWSSVFTFALSAITTLGGNGVLDGWISRRLAVPNQRMVFDRE
jgi:hypothetical protein